VRLTAEDRRILGLESARVAGHTLKVTTLGPDATPIALAELREHVGDRLERVPRLRERLSEDRDGLAWAPYSGFDLDDHVREHPRTATLEGAVAELMEGRLDRERPLWTLDLVGGHTVVLRVHHAMADGMAVRRIATALLWDVDEPPRRPSPPATPDVRRRHRFADAARLSAAVGRELAPDVSRSPLGRRVGSSRVVAFASAELAAIGSLRDAFGVHLTVNDLVLAATAGGLRRWLLARDAPLHRMRVKVPVSLHRAEDPGDALGNDDSFFFVDLPLTEADPVARLLAISRECTVRKARHDALELDTFLHDAGALSRAAVHWSMSPHVFTLNVSNVPGPRGAVTTLGRPVRAVYALAEVADWHALRVAVFSTGGVLTFGLCADREGVDRLELVTGGIEEELRSLHAAAGQPS
jgi:diacylglycerol O-acyltransferase / wax synthase